ncbi:MULTISPECIES: thiamine pyrophosphate-binding protein [Paenibacillus]|uniref:Thiamine pyrophosphate-binding protein n=1 Tax=Paenibacillus campinasensis TaxID=66347 RepID=A0ABW9SWC0_9BACL|nr:MULTISPECIES: thiamine pyrophosphate-binding protein [Paenibacillus]MUG65290.1 thiamine pyrophosphate-binding protein [Paenibacillus campinasensis]PAK47406.1 thiamine pyrophosphate-binding protein [Paenibacillus sp. 7541]
MNIAEAILKYLREVGVDHIFGIPAGIIGPIYDALIDVDMKPIITKNEAGAAYMAARYASTSGKLAVCAGAGAVGVGNMMNGIADAMRAKAPLLIITGYVNRWQIGKGAIQEMDAQDIVRPITKYSNTVMNEADVLAELDKAVRIALTPPFGPVHISIPIDVQRMEAPNVLPEAPNLADLQVVRSNPKELEDAVSLLNEAEQGIIMVGRGGRAVAEEIMQLSERLQWPIITTPSAKGIIPGDFPLNLGNYGFSSTDAAMEYVTTSQSSCILILGTSLGEASTCNFNDMLVEGRKVIHVDRDAREIGKVFKTDAPVLADLKDALPYFLEHAKPSSASYKKPLPLNEAYQRNHTGLSLRLFLEKLSKVMPNDTRYVCDIGEFTNFVLKYLEIPAGGDFEINLNYGAMGSAMAGGPGLYLADSSRPVAVIAGDGSFFMNGTEVLTAKEYELPVIYFIINNAMLSYVDRGQKFLYNRTMPDYKQDRISIADMMRIAGIPSMSVGHLDDMDDIPGFVRERVGPCIIEVNTDGSEPAPILDRLKALKHK